MRKLTVEINKTHGRYTKNKELECPGINNKNYGMNQFTEGQDEKKTIIKETKL